MFILQDKPIDLTQTKMMTKNSLTGAMVNFEGIVRSDEANDTQVQSLLYIANTPECLSEGEKIVNEAIRLFSLNSALCIQRIGQVQVGEAATWISVCSAHRDEAFKGCRYIIEETKKRLLIWKKEFYTNGTSQWKRGTETPVIL